MFVPHSFRTQMAGRAEERSSVHIPMVYERVAAEPVRWEYHVLKVDTHESALPDTGELNALGKEGWVLAGMLDERITGKSTFVYYYFTRQQG